jgi:hypothetical protein
MDGKPRMTAEEADARFAALVAEARGERRSSKSHGTLATAYPGLAMLIVYLIGVGMGAASGRKLAVPILLGVGIFAFRWGVARFSRGDGS